MSGFRVAETNDIIELQPVTVHMPMVMPTISGSDGRQIPVDDAIAILNALVDYWRARAARYESELADLKAQQSHEERPQ